MTFQGRESGTLNRYAMPMLSLTHKHVLNCRPHQIALNCSSTYVLKSCPLFQTMKLFTEECSVFVKNTAQLKEFSI